VADDPVSDVAAGPPAASDAPAEAGATPDTTGDAAPSGGPDAAPDGARVPERRRRRGLRAFVTTVMMLGAALLAFAVGITIFNAVVMPRLVHGVNDVRVPELKGLTLEQAEQTLRPLGLQLSRAGERFDPSLPRGCVLEQDPAPGEFLRGGRRVSVVASLGEEFINGVQRAQVISDYRVRQVGLGQCDGSFHHRYPIDGSEPSHHKIAEMPLPPGT